MEDFDYVVATSTAEVVSLLAANGGAQVFCGGTDLLVQLRAGRRSPALLIDLKQLPELNELNYHPLDGLRLGAAVSCLRLSRHPLVSRLYPGLVEAVELIGGVQIQGRASVGGNLCNASPAADSIPALIVHRANCLIAGPGGRRSLPVEAFYTGPGQTALQRGEFLLGLHLPPPPPHFGAAYLRFIPRNEMDIAVAGAGASLVLDASGEMIVTARLALAAVAPTPLFVPEVGEYLAGRAIGEPAQAQAALEGAAALARQAARPINDLRGSAAQRRQLVEVLSRRALERAIRRARAA
jgi:CO/xanthine dehydrogenase FAD-binding subunit